MLLSSNKPADMFSGRVVILSDLYQLERAFHLTNYAIYLLSSAPRRGVKRVNTVWKHAKLLFCCCRQKI